MTDVHPDAGAIVGPCPWCGPGTTLTLRGDGFGGQALWCTQCACKGPTTPIEGDFADADAAARSRWGRLARAVPAVDPSMLARLRGNIELNAWLGGGTVRADQNIALPYGDLCVLLAHALGDAPLQA